MKKIGTKKMGPTEIEERKYLQKIPGKYNKLTQLKKTGNICWQGMDSFKR